MRWFTRGLAVSTVAMVAGTAAAAAIFTAGADGFYPTVQAAIDQAVTQGGDAEIEVEAGAYHEHLLVSPSFSSATLRIVGGWDGTFSGRSSDPSMTVIDGDASGRAMALEPGGGTLIIEDLTLTNGMSTSAGGGLYLHPTGSVSVTVSDCRITLNNATAAASAEGGGIDAYLSGSSVLAVVNTVISDNLAHSTGGSAAGGGLEIVVSDVASAGIRGCRIQGNTARSDVSSQVTGGGIDGAVYEQADMVISDSLVSDNTLAGSGFCFAPGGAFSLGAFSTTPQGMLTATRNRWLDNTCTTASAAPQVDVNTSGATLALVTDSELVGGNGGGAEAHAYDTSQIELVNLTVAGNSGPGLYLVQQHSSALSLANAIVDLNGTNIVSSGTVTTTTNLVGSDPHFKDAAGGDYGVLADSSAIDQGSNTVAGGLGSMDINRCARIQNGIVDEGATEQASVYCGGFELGGPFRWSSVVGTP